VRSPETARLRRLLRDASMDDAVRDFQNGRLGMEHTEMDKKYLRAFLDIISDGLLCGVMKKIECKFFLVRIPDLRGEDTGCA
jgi:hypothetical protein